MIDSQQVTVDLPLPLYHFLQRLAEQTRQPVEKLVAQSVAGNLPPSVDNLPSEMQAELLALQWQPLEELQRIAQAQVAPEQQERHLLLLGQDNLTSTEQTELAQPRPQADQLMLRKAYAWAVLRWRGYHTPRLDEIPLE